MSYLLHARTRGCPRFVWSSHAFDRASEMGVSEDEVEGVLGNPSITYPNACQHPEGITYVDGRLAVPVANDGTILTILWNGRCGRSSVSADENG